jgi:hypothetical protein
VHGLGGRNCMGQRGPDRALHVPVPVKEATALVIVQVRIEDAVNVEDGPGFGHRPPVTVRQVVVPGLCHGAIHGCDVLPPHPSAR